MIILYIILGLVYFGIAGAWNSSMQHNKEFDEFDNRLIMAASIFWPITLMVCILYAPFIDWRKL